MVYYALRGRNWTFHVECDVSSINRRRVPYHSRLFRPLAVYHIFHNTDTYSLFSLYKRGGIESKAFKNKNFEKKSAKNVWKKNFGKKIWKKNFGKINYKTKIFISKIYSNIEKCHTIFFLGSTLRQNRAIWTKSGEKIYHGLRAVGNSLTTWAISLHRWYEILVPGLPPRWSAEQWVPQKSQMLCRL